MCYTDCIAVRHSLSHGYYLNHPGQTLNLRHTNRLKYLNIYIGLWYAVSSFTVPYKTFTSLNYPVLHCPPRRYSTAHAYRTHFSVHTYGPFCPVSREKNFTDGSTAYWIHFYSPSLNLVHYKNKFSFMYASVQSVHIRFTLREFIIRNLQGCY